ncbi:MAG: hypothetical protein PUA96_05805 [Bacteroidales bacterium]|nr:hypothetical protein [Bacteroidales bacterium]
MRTILSYKKAVAMIALAAVTSAASAQTVSDALKFGDYNYYGTARSIAMGNAFTALGGDLGSVNINPAGSAVNSFSQITITPNVSFSASKASYCAEPSVNPAFGSAYKNNSTRFTMPNIGAMINFETGRKTGLKNVSFGFVANATSNFIDNTAAAGRNGETSFAGSLAARATGLPFSGLNSSSAYDSYDWLSAVGLQSGIIANYGDGDSDYIGVTEKLYEDNTIQLADDIDQRYGRQAYGNKYDMVFNFGLNFSDKIYFGANLGIISMDYSYDQYFKEFAVNNDSFNIDYDDGNGGIRTAYLDALRYRYAYEASGAGVYGKFGIIAVPVKWLRLGLAFQTPTALRIKEHWQHAGDTYFTDASFNASAQSPRGEYEYKFVSPCRVNAGAAVTFGSFGLLSADYEMSNYSTMKFKEIDTNDNSAFEPVNQDIKDYTGPSHSLRIGTEIRPLPFLGVRAGYNLVTSGERYFDSFGNKQAPKAKRHAVAAGLGFSSKGAFFADLAFRGTFYPKEYIYPYDDYILDGGQVLSYTPEILSKKKVWDVMLTLGFRF